MKEIPLTQGKVTLVDDADFQHLNQWKWQALKGKKGKWYAVRWKYPEHRIIFMHREIMNTPEGMFTDHRDNDGLNNRRYNLRVCTRPQNGANRGKNSTNSSGYKGVSWNKKDGNWQANIRSFDELIYLGSYDDPVEAAKAYDAAAVEYFGEFAYLNFP